MAFDLTARKNVKIGIDLQDYCDTAKRLRTTVPTIRAVDAIESAGSGFLPSRQPKILFEGHVFYAELRRYGKAAVIAREAPSICYPEWTKIHYIGRVGEYRRLQRAIELCEKYGVPIECALKAASWGRFQVMGNNYAKCGYQSVTAFVEAMFLDEDNHLKAFIGYIENAHLADELRDHKWTAFAYGYNGPGYRRNQYHIKLPNAYRSFAKIKVNCELLPRTEVAAFFPAERNPLSELIEDGVTHTSLDDRYLSSITEAAQVSEPAVVLPFPSADSANPDNALSNNSVGQLQNSASHSEAEPQKQLGDNAESNPRLTINYQDYLPLALSYLKKVTKIGGLGTIVSGLGLSAASVSGLPFSAKIAVAVFGALILLFITALVAIGIVALGLLLYKIILKIWEAYQRGNPNMQNIAFCPQKVERLFNR